MDTMHLKRVCVFCGANSGSRPVYLEAAFALARETATRRLGLVYGGASIGLMGAIANVMIENSGEVIGVIPQHIVDLEVAHSRLKDLRVVQTMHERKALMADLSDAFIAMPGGFGTLDELCEILTWSQLGLHAKPIGLLNVAGYFDSFLAFADHAVREGFLKLEHRQLLRVHDDPGALLTELQFTSNPPDLR